MLYIDADNLITLPDLADSDGYIDNATVTGQLIDRATGDVLYSYSLSHVSGGTYQGVIPHSVTDDLSEDQKIRHEVLATVGGYQLPARENDVAGYYQF